MDVTAPASTMVHSRRRFLQMAVVAQVGLLAAACATPAAAPAPQPTTAKPANAPVNPAATPAAAQAAATVSRKPMSLDKIRVFYQLPNDPSAVPDLATFKMLKDDYGVTVDLVQMNGSDAAIAAVIAGQVDFASSGLGAVIVAAGQGQEVQAFSPGPYQATYQMVVRKEVDGWPGLVGKTVGMTANNDPSYYTAALQMQKHGADPNGINWIAVRGTPARLAALQAGKIDGGELSATAAQQALKDPQFKPLDRFAVDYPSFLFSGFYTTKAFIRDHADVVQAFTTAHLKQYRAMNDKTTYMAAATALLPQDFSEPIFSESFDLQKDMNTWDPDRLVWDASTGGDLTSDLLAKFGVVERFVPFNEWATSQFVEAARKEIGPYQS